MLFSENALAVVREQEGQVGEWVGGRMKMWLKK